MTSCQRWRDRRDSYRPARETITVSEFDVAAIDEDTTARAFVERHHYSASYPAARERFGFYRCGELVGVAVFSHPTNDKVLTATFPSIDRLAAVELGRLVLLDDVAANGESYFVARCFEQLRARAYRGVVSFSDPIARATVDGRSVMPGHVGTVYQALNARYLGRGTARTLRLLPDGTVLSPRTLQKIRAGERGWIAAVAQLEAFGAEKFDGDARAWVRRIVPDITRPLRHPGNHKYAWALDRRVRLPAQTISYPKLERAA
jgi:hypothetical protein